MKFKLKDNAINIESNTPLEDYLRELNITKVESFISQPCDSDEENWAMISYIHQGIDMLKKHIDNDSKIFLQVD